MVGKPAALVRIALTIFTILGVVWMHSVGHSFNHSGGSHLAVHRSDGDLHGVGQPAVLAMQPGPVTVQALGPICQPGCSDSTDLDPFSMCLAILGSLGLLLLLAAAWVSRARAHLTSRLPMLAGRPIGRGPPGLRLGLRLTRLSVLRT